MGGGVGLQFLEPATERDPSAIVARRMVQVVLAEAEELYLADADASLGTWLARVEETAAVAARETMGAIEARKILADPGTAGNIAGVFADLCAESIRAAGQLVPESPDPREDILTALEGQERGAAFPGWGDILEALASAQAALEPVANALRHGDVEMDLAGSNPDILDGLVAVASFGYGVVRSLCQ
jgi:hypothetical protein